ncbi:serine/threonine-protein kinase [Thermocatellispora tengchongensis]|uniref:serine/threonine-protein kinase n=1 Tax=Thermocatellispora tengchongensis TaxID=1073253 RepID=UPI00363EADB8
MVPGYHEVRQLGTGSAGRVVLATYAATGAYVAIRYLRPLLWADPEFLARFRDEARHLVELENPHVVRLHEYVETPTSAALVVELVDGVSLRAILDERGKTSVEAALALLKGSLLGLAAAHDVGIAHRAYKPENVLVQADGGTKIADFGLALPGGRRRTRCPRACGSATPPPTCTPRPACSSSASPAARRARAM